MGRVMRVTKAAIEAAAIALHAAFTEGRDEEPADYVDEAVTALEAAMPHIRTQIARDIRAEMVGRNWNKTFLNGLEYGAYIAEKEENQ